MSLQVRRLASTVLAQLPPSFRSSRQPRVVSPTSGFLTYFSAFLPTGLCMRALAQTRIAWHSCVVPGQAFERDQAGCKCLQVSAQSLRSFSRCLGVVGARQEVAACDRCGCRGLEQLFMSHRV